MRSVPDFKIAKFWIIENYGRFGVNYSMDDFSCSISPKDA